MTNETAHVVTFAVVGVGLLLFAVAGRLALGSGEAAIQPAGKFSVKGLVEATLEFVVGLSDMVCGEEGREYVPMFAAIFFFIFVQNMFGLIPGFSPATENTNTTFALGIFGFMLYNYHGFRAHGIAYLKQFLGPLLPLAFMMLPIELLGHCIRPLTLGLRLYANIMADHTVIAMFVNLFEKVWFIPVPVIFYALGIFVAFMQAFVYMMLMMIYISMAISHDH